MFLSKRMFSVGTEDEYYGDSAMSTEPSDYELHVARLAEERESKRQVKAFGKVTAAGRVYGGRTCSLAVASVAVEAYRARGDA